MAFLAVFWRRDWKELRKDCGTDEAERWEEEFLRFSYEIRKLAVKYSEDRVKGLKSLGPAHERSKDKARLGNTHQSSGAPGQRQFRWNQGRRRGICETVYNGKELAELRGRDQVDP